MDDQELADLLQKIGEPVSISYEPRNEDMEWMVSLERVPMIHDHFATPKEGLEWLVKNRALFPEWETQIQGVYRSNPESQSH